MPISATAPFRKLAEMNLRVAVSLIAAASLTTGCSRYCKQYSLNLPQAKQHLEATQVFEYPPSSVMYGAAKSVCAFQRVLESEEAESLFVELAQTATPPGKAYAVAGLTALGSDQLAGTKRGLESELDTRFEFQSACEVGGTRLHVILDQIEERNLDSELARAYKGDPPW